MKLNFVILLLAFAMISFQSCSPKSDKETEIKGEPVADENSASETADLEREAKVEKEQEALAEKRRADLEVQAKIIPTYTDKDGNLVYNKAEVDPSFDGGSKAMFKYLRNNVVFPPAALDKGLEGSVFVDFVITKDGNVREVEVTDETSKSTDQSFRDEAIRVVKSMPKWLPGRQRGENVDVKFSIPITFRLS
jgi:periplasmic protein TonB